MANDGTILTAADLGGQRRPRQRPRRARQVRHLRRALRARGAHPGARRGRRGLREGQERRRVPARVRPPAAHVRRAADHADRGRRASPSRRAARGSSSSARTSTHTGAHKINNVLGQALLTKRLGKKRVIAETGAGQHGVATATAAALLGLECVDLHGRGRLRAPGAQRRPDEAARRHGRPGHQRHPDAQGRHQRGVPRLGRQRRHTPTTCSAPSPGPHPFPEIVRDFARVIGVEARRQILELTGRLPDAVVACVGGGTNAIGIFHAFIGDEGVQLHGYEAGGHGLESGEHALTLTARLRRRAARLAHLRPAGRRGPDDRVALDLGRPRLPRRRPRARLAQGHRPRHLPRRSPTPRRWTPSRCCASTEGIIPAIESSHALAGALELGRELGPEATILVNLSGRGDKDMGTAMKYFNL